MEFKEMGNLIRKQKKQTLETAMEDGSEVIRIQQFLTIFNNFLKYSRK